VCEKTLPWFSSCSIKSGCIFPFLFSLALFATAEEIAANLNEPVTPAFFLVLDKAHFVK